MSRAVGRDGARRAAGGDDGVATRLLHVDTGALVVDHRQVDPLRDPRRCREIARVARRRIDRVRDHGRVRILDREVVSRVHRDDDRLEPVGSVERDPVDVDTRRRVAVGGIGERRRRVEPQIRTRQADVHVVGRDVTQRQIEHDRAGRGACERDCVVVRKRGDRMVGRRRPPALENDARRIRRLEGRVGRVELRDQHVWLVVVVDRHLDVAHDRTVVAGERCIRVTARLNHGVRGSDDARPLRTGVVDRVHPDVLVGCPVDRVEDEHDRPVGDRLGARAVQHQLAIEIGGRDRLPSGGEQERVPVVPLRRAVRVRAVQARMLGARRVRRGDGDVDLAVDTRDAARADRCGREVDGVRIERGHRQAADRRGARRRRDPELDTAVFVDGRAAASLRDHDAALPRPRDAQVDAVGDEPVVVRVARDDVVVDRAARALDVEGGDVAGDVAGHIERVVAEAADDARGDSWRGREDVDRVVALEGVDLEHLDVRVRHLDADSVDRLRGDDDVIGVLGAEDDELVEAVAAVDRDRCVHVVLDLVRACARADVALGCGRETTSELRHRDLVLGVDPDDLAVGALGCGECRVVRVAGRACRRVAAMVVGLSQCEAPNREEIVAVAPLEP